jgi:hypothetical protein
MSGLSFCVLTRQNLYSFSIEKELLCEAQICIGTLWHRVKILAFQLTAHIELMKGDDYV